MADRFRFPLRRLCGALALACARAAAQDTDAPAQMGAIEVTGSHIRSIDLETQHPVLVLERADLLRTGLTDIADIVQSIVDNGQTQNRNINNENDGRQLVNLRSLGANRTLVLINGERWGSGLDGAVDLSAIPLALVERVEVLRDGASAIYGSDAIAGVINIITRKDYNGAEIGAYFGVTDHDDGLRRDFDVTFGHHADAWSIAVGAEYGKDDPILAGDRNISSVPRAGLPVDATGKPFDVFGESGNFLVLTPGRSGTSPGDFHPYDPAHDFIYNYAPLNYLQTPLDRRAIFAQGRYEVSPTVSLSADVLWNDRRSTQQLAPPPLTIGSLASTPGAPDDFGVSSANLYNPFGEDVTDLVLRRFVEAGLRRFEQDVDTTRLHVGLDGLIDVRDRAFTWGVDALHTRIDQHETTTPYFDDARVALAVGPSFLDASGTPRCGTPESIIAGCVPLNVFGPPGSVTPAMLDYIEATAHNRTQGDSADYNAHLAGAIFDLPAGAVNLALGAEHRRESGSDTPDALLASGRANGTGVTYEGTSGAYSVDEAYGELEIPLLNDKPGARELDFIAATRWSDYSNFGSTLNSQLGLRWKPIDDLLLRANIAEGFRAPSVSDLFGGAISEDDALVDPCASVNNPNPAVAARCRALGVPANVTNAGSTPTTIGGNPDLSPETARTRTIGLVYDPAWLAGISASLDWYRIEVRNAIGERTPQAVVDACYERGDPDACLSVTRGADGELSHVLATSQNLPGGLETEGYDLGLAWRRETRLGLMELRWDTAYVDYFGELGKPRRGTLLADGSPAQGNVVGANSNPGDFYGVVWRWRSTAALNWQRGSWSASIDARYFSPIIEDCSTVTNIADELGDASLRNLCSDPNHLTDGAPAPQNRVGSVTYFDLQAAWNAPWKGRFALGLRNAFDRNPPVAYSAAFNSFFPDYDVPGRFWYASYRQGF